MKKIILFLTIWALFLSKITMGVVITEVSNNPIGNSISIPGDLSHEYIEIFNNSDKTIPVNAIYFKTESATSSASADSNDLVQWFGDSLRDIGKGVMLRYPAAIAPGEVAVVLGRKYVSAPESSWYLFPEGTIIFGTRKTYVRSGGLSNTAAVVSLHLRNSNHVSTFNVQRRVDIDPGEGNSWSRVQVDSSDSPHSWVRGSSNPGVIPTWSNVNNGCNKIEISEFMANPATGCIEWIEFFNSCPDSINLSGWRLQTGGREGWLSFTNIIALPQGYFITAGELRNSDPLLQGRLVPVIKAENWGGLGNNSDVIVLRRPDGSVADSVCYDQSWSIKKGVSFEKKNGIWNESCSKIGSTPGNENSECGSGSTKVRMVVGNRVLRRGCSDANGALTITFEPSFAGTVDVYDLKGNLRAMLLDKKAGEKSLVQWNGKSRNGRIAEPGVYFVDVKGSNLRERIGISVVQGCK